MKVVRRGVGRLGYWLEKGAWLSWNLSHVVQ
jgi:hypothetical protein